MRIQALSGLCLLFLAAPLWAQTDDAVVDDGLSVPVTETGASAEDVETPITGGVTYNPRKDEFEEKPRDPFKSPFDLAKEQEEAKKSTPRFVDPERHEEMIQELNLKGIYLEARTGYWAIFEVGGEYKWYRTGEKFQDGDLVNITDNEVLFKQYIDDESQDLAHREIVLELHRGEE